MNRANSDAIYQNLLAKIILRISNADNLSSPSLADAVLIGISLEYSSNIPQIGTEQAKKSPETVPLDRVCS